MGVLGRSGIVAGLLAIVAAAPAAAVPDCNPMPQQQVLLSGQGRLESIVGDSQGRLFYTDLSSSRLLRLDRRGAAPKVIAEEMNGPGGLVFDRDGSLIAGFNGRLNGR